MCHVARPLESGVTCHVAHISRNWINLPPRPYLATKAQRAFTNTVMVCCPGFTGVSACAMAPFRIMTSLMGRGGMVGALKV